MTRKTLLIKASLAISVGAILSKVLGFVREMVIASRFGATSHVDAYVIAQGLPGLLFAAIGGALGTVVIPLFTAKRIKEGKDRAFRMAGTIWNAVALGALVVIVFGEIAMPWLVRLVAPGFRGAVFDETILLGRILMPAAFFTGVGLLARGMLNSLQHFTVPALADPVQNIIIITTVLTLGRMFGIKGLAAGTLLGMGAQLFMIWPVLARHGFHPGLRIDWRMPELREIWLLTIPVLVGTGIGTINALVDRMLASGLPEGNVAAMNYATRIYTLPMVLWGTALGTALYPTMTEFAAVSDWDRIAESIRRGLRLAAFGLLPMSAGLIVLSEPITKLVYERGAFDPQATNLTAGVMSMYSLGVVAISWRDIIGRAFYALHDTLTPLWTGVLAVAVNIGLNLALVGVLGSRGLALATAIASWIGALSLAWLLEGKLARADRDGTQALPLRASQAPLVQQPVQQAGARAARVLDRAFWREVGKSAAATAAMAATVAVFWQQVAVPRVNSGGTVGVAAWFLADAGLGAATYLVAALVLGIEDLKLLTEVACRASLRARSIGRRSRRPGGDGEVI
ncbi:MAG TPA: murein biosynthesis integral membrane protein MurJ [Firmicutes bacterium]|nr:murein biosynthesis integral membrane protein MurJ [Bacillota bacterium]